MDPKHAIKLEKRARMESEKEEELFVNKSKMELASSYMKYTPMIFMVREWISEDYCNTSASNKVY